MREAARWVTARGYHSLIIVTADYHMPRSWWISARRCLGAARPYPWQPTTRNPQLENARRLSGEYVKYLASVARVLLPSGRTIGDA